MPYAWVSGAVLAAICFACWAGVLFLPRLVRTEKAPSYVGEFKKVRPVIRTFDAFVI